MSRRVSIATGNFTAASTWGVVDDTSYLDSELGSTASTTSFVYSSTFTPGAITIDRIAVKVASRTASPSGTVTIELYNNTDSVSVASLAINATDIANSNSGAAYNRGWYVFNIGSTTLLAGKAYKIGFKTSSSGTVTLYRDNTAGNWARMLVTTTTGAPASGDQLHVVGLWTAAATRTDYTVTMNETATTSYGPTVSGGPPQGITIGIGGTMTCGTSASTNYYLKWKGVFAVCDGGTLNIGTSGTNMPSTSSAVFEMDVVSLVDTGFDWGHGATVNVYGHAKFTTSFKSVLNTDEAAASTVLGIADTTGWANGDEICLASTTRTNTQAEKRTISTVNSGTQVTVSSGLTNAHSGTSPTQASVGNLTRNVKIRGIGTNAPSTSTTLQGYINIASTAVVTLRYAEFYYLGSATSNKRGIDVATTTGTFDMQYCSIHEGWISNCRGVSVSSASGSNITFSHNVTFNLSERHYINVATSGTQVVNDNLFCLNIGNPMVDLADAGTTLTNNIISSSANIGLQVLEQNLIGTHSGNTVHSCGSVNVSYTRVCGGTVTNLTCWRASAIGGLSVGLCANVTFDAPVLFGNSTANVRVSVGNPAQGLTFNSMVANGDTSFATSSGVYCDDAFNATFNDCDFSTVTGIKTAHTNDVLINAFNPLVRFVFDNCKMGASAELGSQTNLAVNSYIGSQKHDQTAGSHKTWKREGTLTIDTTASMYDVTPSLRLTPNNASEKLSSLGARGGWTVPVVSGASLNASVKIRKSVAGDGAAYNGNQPRLMVRKNTALGISSDTVVATATNAANGAFETISGTTPTATGDDGAFEFYVDCDGTTGWVNADTFSAS